MKKFLALLFFMLTMTTAIAEEFTLSAGVVINDIPKAFFGSWRITAKLVDTNSYGIFKPTSVDMWNLSRVGDRIMLSNPFSGANAEISVKAVEGNLVVFSKKAPYDNKVLTDTVTLRLSDNTFSGINEPSRYMFSVDL